MEPKISLTQAFPEHAAAILKAMEGAKIENFEMLRKPITVEEEIIYINRIINEGNKLYLVQNEDNRIVGTAGLHEVDTYNHTARVGITIFQEFDHHSHYGSLVMVEIIRMAFEELGMEKLYANIIATNTHQIKWDESFGFKKEDELEKEYLLDGVRHDMVSLALLKSNWLKTR